MTLAGRDGTHSRIAAHRSSVEELRGQLATLKCDLQHFAASHSSPVLNESIRRRIQEVEAQLAKTLADTVPSRLRIGG